tara:strand:- start:2336 stop:2533 length:198 start_codon:yes stop_codon:yes gene_type:complete
LETPDLSEMLSLKFKEAIIKEFDDQAEASKEYQNYYNYHIKKGYGEIDSHKFAYTRMKKIIEEGR